MDSIFHERQQGQLCAQHCLNNLLQGPYFTAVDLAGIARELDDAEQDRMAEGGVASQDFLKFMQQPSSNMDDSGYFSVQVISRALCVWNLDLTPFSSPSMKHAVEDPTVQTAYICNHDSHWLTVRKLGKQWFNLDSLQRRPKLISDTYLSLFLTQLQMEGYSIFVVVGCLPTCEADELLTLVPVQPEKESPSHPQSGEWKHSRESKPPRRDCQPGTSASTMSHSTVESKQCGRDYRNDDFAAQLATALSESSKESEQYTRDFNQEEEDLAVQLVTAMSESYSLALKKEQEEVMLVLDSSGGGTLLEEVGDTVVSGSSSEDGDAETTDVALAAAISASLDDQKECSDVSNEPVLSESEQKERKAPSAPLSS